MEHNARRLATQADRALYWEGCQGWEWYSWAREPRQDAVKVWNTGLWEVDQRRFGESWKRKWKDNTISNLFPRRWEQSDSSWLAEQQQGAAGYRQEDNSLVCDRRLLRGQSTERVGKAPEERRHVLCWKLLIWSETQRIRQKDDQRWGGVGWLMGWS